MYVCNENNIQLKMLLTLYMSIKLSYPYPGVIKCRQLFSYGLFVYPICEYNIYHFKDQFILVCI